MKDRIWRFIFFTLGIVIVYISIFNPKNILGQDGDGGDTVSVRQKWFVRDRAFPNEDLSNISVTEALEYQQEMMQVYGYYLPTQSPWASKGPTPECDGTGNCNENWTGRIQSVIFKPYDSNNPNEFGNVLYIAGHNGGSLENN